MTHTMRTLVAFLAVLSGGCGLVFNGRNQWVTVKTTPPGATVSAAGQTTTSPGRIRLHRPDKWAVIRAEQTGYDPACRIVHASMGSGRTVLFILLDAPIYAFAYPLDFPLNTLREYPDTVDITLHPSAKPTALPADDEVLDAWKNGEVNLCNPHVPHATQTLRLRNTAEAHAE